MTDIKTFSDFQKLQSINPGMIIVKFGAKWCAPCRNMENFAMEWFAKLPPKIEVVNIDIDESLELYGFMKNKKMLKGIPAILMYEKGNETHIFDDAVNSSNIGEIDNFFTRCLARLSVMTKNQ